MKRGPGREISIRNAKLGTEAVRRRMAAREPWECAECGAQRLATVHQCRQRYCSKACMAVAYQRRLTGAENPNFRDLQPKTCIGCGAEYRSYNKERKYCSHRCYLEVDAQMPHRRNRRDCNHAEIVEAFQRLGWSVLDTAEMGRGVPDLVIGDRSHGTHMVEIKNTKTYYGRKGLSKSQKAFTERWQGAVYVVTSLDDVVALTRKLAGGERADGGPMRVITVESPEQASEIAKNL